MNELNSLAVFCGSSDGIDPIYKQTAIKLANEMSNRNISLIYGGGNIGLMGTIADTLHTQGGNVTGVIPEKLNLPKICNKQVHDELIVVPGMHERKAKMYQLADGFIALPGGIGTFEEILEIFTWQQLRYHSKPVAILNVNGFYDQLLEFLRHSCNEGFIRPIIMETLLIDDDPVRLLDAMKNQTVNLPDKIV